MEEIGVLEQDILISDILAWAEKVGFSDVFLAPAFEPTSTIDASQWRRLGRKWGMLGAEPRLLARQVVDYARKHPAMVLVKPGGSLRQITLPCGKIVSVDAPRSVSAGQLFRVEALAANTGTLVWSCHSTIMQRNPLNQGEGGDVALGFKLRPADGSYCDRAYGRGQLRRDVLPGETIDIVSLLRAPTTQGMYRIKVDLVQEAVAWFEDLGCTPVWLELEVGPPLPGVHTDSRIPGQLTAEIHPEGGISPNGLLAVRVRNTGDTIWLNEPASETGMPPSTTGFVTLGAQLLDSARNLLNRDFYRLPLGCHIEPGQEVRLILALGDRVAGLPPGACFLKLDMVDEGIAWFESRGSKPAIVPLGKH